MKIVIVLATLVVGHFLLNVIRLMNVSGYYASFKRNDPKMAQYSAPLEQLFDSAGTNKVLASTRYSMLKISSCVGDRLYQSLIDDTFQKTIGVYKYRAVNSFNPLYWLRLPKRFLRSIGIQLPGPIEAVFSRGAWLAGVIAAYYINSLLDAGALRDIISACRNTLK